LRPRPRLSLCSPYPRKTLVRTRSPPSPGVRADADILAGQLLAPVPVPEIAGVWVGSHAYVEDLCASGPVRAGGVRVRVSGLRSARCMRPPHWVLMQTCRLGNGHRCARPRRYRCLRTRTWPKVSFACMAVAQDTDSDAQTRRWNPTRWCLRRTCCTRRRPRRQMRHGSATTSRSRRQCSSLRRMRGAHWISEQLDPASPVRCSLAPSAPSAPLAPGANPACTLASALPRSLQRLPACRTAGVAWLAVWRVLPCLL
jgi:hypothetical protein